MMFFETGGITQWNIAIWAILSYIAPLFFSLHCVTADEPASLNIRICDRFDLYSSMIGRENEKNTYKLEGGIIYNLHDTNV